QSLAFEVNAGETTHLDPLWEAEPRMLVIWPEGCSERWIEAGSDSLTEDSGGLPDSGDEVALPARRPLTFHFRLDGHIFFRHLEEAMDGQTIDLRNTPPWSGGSQGMEPNADRPQAAAARHTVHLIVPEASRMLELHLEWPQEGMSLTPDPSQQGLHHLEGPMGSSYLIEITGKGLVRTWLRGRIPDSPSGLNSVVVPVVESASLEWVDAQGQAITDAAVVGLDTRFLHPGPLAGTLLLADGRRLGFRLNLAPGEHRVLRLVKD
ncbi:MAG: hypothetical protein KDB61_11605, partial [Planctomycetes bacterium]|nr:hypothetical protein [Planctomycetota bacterium]